MATSDFTVGTAVYVPWRTFTNTLDALAAHMPNRIDKSAFPGQSGAVQSQLIIAFRFLGLIDDDGKPTASLHAVAVADEANRKAALKKIVELKYADLFSLNLTKATPSEFADRIAQSYGVTGDTRIKATRFFLMAASYLGIPVSPLLARDKSKPAGNGGTAVRRRRVKRTRSQETADPPPFTPPPPAKDPEGERKTVTLKSGGTLTVLASTTFMSLSAKDRSFVFSLVEKLEEYERELAEGKTGE
jgi:hypothetical protein